MLKKILIGVAALGLTAAALANGNSISESTALAAVPASEFDPGLYVGLQAGYGLTGWKKVQGADLSVSKDGNIAGRVLVGYDFTKYWAAEAGYTYFAKKTEIKAGSTLNGDVRTQAWDLVAKGKIPVVDDFEMYGKVGVGYLMSKGLQHTSNSFFLKDKQNNFAGVVGAGAEYYFMPNLWMDLSWTRFMVANRCGNLVSGGTTYTYGKYQPDADLFALGVAYKFNF